MKRTALLLSLLTVATATMNAAQPGIILKDAIFGGTPFGGCHASTIAESTEGLVAAWFAGTREKNPDVSIWVARKSGTKWSQPVEVDQGFAPNAAGAEVDQAAWNPVLFQQPGGDLMLFYKIGLNPREWWGAYKTSSDGGKTWSERIKLPKNIFGPIKNKPVLLPDGTLLSGSSTEDKGWRVHFESTKDWGETWQRTRPINNGVTVGAIQPSILQMKDGSLMALGRSQQKLIWTSTSRDSGKTWSEMRLLDLPNPNAGTDALTTKSSQHVLVYNHTPRGRTPLNVAVSHNGLNWNAAAVLENAPGEYSYPAVIQTADGLIHITYTWRRKQIVHAVLDLAKLPTQQILQGVWPR
jgi:predicted neuraminidase